MTSTDPDDALAYVVDATGKPCPYPIIAAAKQLAALALSSPGRSVTLRILSDDAASAYDIPVWCQMRQLTLWSHTTLPHGVHEFVVRADQ